MGANACEIANSRSRDDAAVTESVASGSIILQLGRLGGERERAAAIMIISWKENLLCFCHDIYVRRLLASLFVGFEGWGEGRRKLPMSH